MNDRELNAIIHKHRDEAAAILEFAPRIEKLIDADHCEQISRFVHSHDAKWERRLAFPKLFESLPTVRGVYMFVWKPRFEFIFDPFEKYSPSWILYVGKAGIDGGSTDTIRHRYQSEYSKYVAKDCSRLWDTTPEKTREEKLCKFLTLRPLEFWFLPLITVAAKEIDLIERQLIRLFNPPVNKAHGARLRPNKPEPAF